MDITVPLEQEGTRVVVRQWLRQPGDVVEENEPLVELETDKVSVEVPSPAAGLLHEILLHVDAEAGAGAVLGRLTTLDRSAFPAGPREDVEAAAVVHADQARVSPGQAASHLSPAVRRAVAEAMIDPASIAGTGRGGRVTREDVDRAVAARAANRGSVSAMPKAPAEVRRDGTPCVATGDVRSIPHDGMRRAIAENMLRSVSVAPHVTAMFEIDFSAVTAHRKRHKAVYERDGANLTVTAYLVRACVAAMRAVPTMNSRWHEDRLEVLDDIGIGIGTALSDKGLVVPVLRRAQDLSLLGIASRLTDFTVRAREGRLTSEDVRGGTFTISNHGISGSLFAAPIIIVQPQSAILGVGKVEKRVVVREVDGVDTIQVRPLAYVSLTIDHRALDGHQTNAWLSAFADHLEHWPLDPA